MASEIELVTQLISANHTAVMARLDAQDKDLDIVKREVRRTNGRVTKLEERNAVTDGIASTTLEIADRKRDSTRFALTAIYVLGGSVLGVIVGGLGHVAGAW